MKKNIQEIVKKLKSYLNTLLKEEQPELGVSSLRIKAELVKSPNALTQYQYDALQICEEKSFDEDYLIHGLTSEAGEVSGKRKKYIRGDAVFDKNGMIKEIGDVLWYVAVLASYYDTTLEEVAKKNIEKLGERKEKGTIKGDGDER